MNNNNMINPPQNNPEGLIPINDFPIVLVEGEHFTALQLLNELDNWIDRIKIRTYLKAMIDVDLLNLDLDGGVNHPPEYINNVNLNFANAENMIFTDEQSEYIDKVSKFIELCNIDEMQDFIIYMNQRF
jgi:hypothetical protein